MPQYVFDIPEAKKKLPQSDSYAISFKRSSESKELLLLLILSSKRTKKGEAQDTCVPTTSTSAAATAPATTQELNECLRGVGMNE